MSHRPHNRTSGRSVALLLCVAAASAHGQLVINEVYYDTTGPVASKQFIELFNAGGTTTYLDGVIVGDEASDGIEGLFRFPGSGTNHPVAPGGYVVVAADADGSDTNAPDLAALAQWECYNGAGDFDNPGVSNLTRIAGLLDLSMYSGGDNVILATGSDTTVPIDRATLLDGMNIGGGGGEETPVSVTYDDENSFATATTGWSLNRCPDGNDSDVASALDFIAAAFSPGAANPSSCPPFAVCRDFSQPEGSSGNSTALFTIVLSYASSATSLVSYATSNGSAVAGSDYTAATGMVVFAPGVRTQQVAISVVADGTVEPPEFFSLRLQAVSNATVARPLPSVTLLNDDVPGLVIADAAVAEGQSGTASLLFVLTLPGPATNIVTVQAQTSNGTAVAGSDYTALSTTVLFQVGSSARTVTVAVLSDTNVEPNETMFVNLANATNAVIADGQGVGTIVNDDANPAIGLRKTVYLGQNGGASCPGLDLLVTTNNAAVTYCFAVTNAGDVTLTNVTVVDASLGVGPLSVGTLVSGQVASVFANDFVSGSLTNTATASGNSLIGGTLVSNSDSAVVIQAESSAPAIGLQKTVYLGHDGGASCPGLELVAGSNGTPVTFCFSVANIGNTALTNVSVVDVSLGIGPIPVSSLASGETANVYTQLFIAGSLTNVATAVGFFGGTAASNSDSAIVVALTGAPPCGVYQIQDLGTLGGSFSDAASINDAGEIVGIARGSNGVDHAFLWRDGSMVQLITNVPNIAASEALDINVHGHVVGYALRTNGPTRGFLYSNGVVSLLEPIDVATNTYSRTYAINNGGQMVGFISTNKQLYGNVNDPCYISNNVVYDLNTFDYGQSGYANDVNTNGVVVGYAYRFTASHSWRAFLWSDTNANFIRDGLEYIDLDSFGGADTYAEARAINQHGAVVGWASITGIVPRHAFLIEPQGGLWVQPNDYNYNTPNTLMQDLGTLGGTNSYAWAINDSGEIVGYSEIADGTSHAVLWRDHAIYDLNAFLCTNTPWVLREARGINNSGQIVGYGTISGQTHGFLLTITTGIVEIIRTEVQSGGGGHVAVYWRGNGQSLEYSLLGSDSLIAPNWTPIAPTGQWPQLSPFWLGPGGEVTSRFIRVRGVTSP